MLLLLTIEKGSSSGHASCKPKDKGDRREGLHFGIINASQGDAKAIVVGVQSRQWEVGGYGSATRRDTKRRFFISSYQKRSLENTDR